MNKFTFLIYELSSHGVCMDANGKFSYKGESYSMKDVYKIHKTRAKENKKLSLDLWNSVKILLEEKNYSYSSELSRCLFVSSIKYLYSLSHEFSFLRKCGIVESMREAVCSDIKSYSEKIMSKVIEHSWAIEWVNHLIYRDLYLCAIMRRVAVLMKKKPTIARGVSGPWGRLDVPLLERTFPWDDIDEEVRGRSRDIRNQRRYRSGLENYNTDDVKEGYYWREIRNEPYAFDDADSNPYPHRNVLWGS